MAATPVRRPSALLLAALTLLLAVIDGILAMIGMMVWTTYRRGNLSAAEAATFSLAGASALIGAAIVVLAAIALARHNQGLARLSSGLAWLRVAAVLIAILVLVLRLGSDAVAGTLATFGAILAIGDTLLAVFISGVAKRRTLQG